MGNNQAYESYKAKCLEKGLAPHYKSAEEFAKAMIEPPRPFSSDVFNGVDEGTTVSLPERRVWEDVVGMDDDIDIEDIDETSEQIVCVCCQEPKSPDAFGTLRNRELRKICKVCHGKSISKARSKNKKIEAVKEIPIVQVDHSAQVVVKKRV